MGTRELHARSMEMKEQHVRKKGPSDLAPLMVAAFDDMTTYVGVAPRGMAEALESGVRMGHLVAASVATLRSQHDNKPLRRMMLMIEGYTQPAKPDTAIPQHGDLAERYANDPDSGVSEALVTNVWDFDGGEVTFSTMLSRFHYDDGGVLVWDETEGPFGVDATGSEGHIADSGRAVMR